MNHALASFGLFGILLVTTSEPPKQPAAAQPAIHIQPQAEWHELKWSRLLAHRVDGVAEFRLPDGSRVDILTDEFAWEVEWVDSWEQAIGQSSYYAIATDRKPGVWLLLRGDSDEDYLRCLMVCRHLGIQLRTEKTE